VPWREKEKTLKSIKVEVELGFDAQTAFNEAQRCLNCDVQTVFTKDVCIECDACVDICPMDCISFTQNGEDINDRPLPMVEIFSQKMGIHEWSYDNEISPDKRLRVPLRDKVVALKDIKAEVELGFDIELAVKEAHRCLNCDVQTVFSSALCIECDACVDICPMDCITFTPNGKEAELRTRLSAPSKNLTQDLYVQDGLKTGRVMVKDEDVCLHCGLCAERCPTGAWDMQKFLLDMTHAGNSCRPQRRSAA